MLIGIVLALAGAPDAALRAADAARTAALNRGAGDAAAWRDRTAQAGYAARLARYREALRAHDRAVAQADAAMDAYRADRAAYEAGIAGGPDAS